MRAYQSADGTMWGVDVKVPSHSSAMVVFKHPDGATARGDRYAWYNAHSPQANDPRARLSTSEVLEGISDRDLAVLFRRSMPVSAQRESYIVS
jgi:hypothetical protein